MMGTGKSTVGKKLAKRLNLQFYDSDRIIEEREGLSIVDIVEFKGETYLKNIELEVITDLMKYRQIILATGGNSFVYPAIREMLLRDGIVIALMADFDTLYERIARRTTRPEFNVEDRAGVLKKLIAEREPIYEEAHIKMHSEDSDVYVMVDKLAFKIKELMGEG